jgi:nitrite reductase/ring-hydroxylating ferredoxin subunit
VTDTVSDSATDPSEREFGPRGISLSTYRFPTGWFIVGFASELVRGQVKRAHYFGEELVIFRTQSGQINVLDAYCQHLGANMGVGGTVEAEHIVCPWHGWHWNGDGTNALIPYSKIGCKQKVRVRTYHSRRQRGCDARRPIRFLSAAPIAADMYRDIEQRYGCRIVTMYGMTEAFPIAYKSVSEEGVPGTSGRVNPAFDVRIVDPHGKPVPEGMVGEITCRARTPHAISEGYVSSASGRPLCRSTRIRTGFAPVTSAYWTTTRT